MPAKSYLGMHRKKLINILKSPNFVKVIKKKSPYSCLRSDNYRKGYSFTFIKLITLTRTSTMICPRHKNIDIKNCS